MGLFSDVKDGVTFLRDFRKNKRSFAEFLGMLQNSAYNHEPNFLDGAMAGYLSLPQMGTPSVGSSDLTISPVEIYEMIHRDTYMMGLFDSLVKSLLKNDFYIDVVKDDNGKDLGSKAQALKYKDGLKRFGFEQLVVQQLFAELADGGGNALVYTVMTSKGLEFRLDPFLTNGRPHVRVYADLRRQKVNYYEVLDETLVPIHRLDPDKNYMKHLKHSEGGGDFRFSDSPSKHAVYWYVLKKKLAGAQVARFNNGLQDPVFLVPDYNALSALVNAMGSSQGRVSDSSIPEYMRNPMEYLARQGLKDDEMLRTIAGRPDKTNQAIRTHMPFNVVKVGANNTDMKVIELIDLCDKQMGYAYRTSKGLINTEDSKFSNAEMERDNWEDMVLDPLKKKIERLTEEFYLPVIDSRFSTLAYRVRFGRDPDAENIEIYNAKTVRNTATANMLSVISTIPNVKYNFDTQEIEPVEQDHKMNEINDQQPDQVEDNDELVEDKGKERTIRAKSDHSISHDAIESAEGKRFKEIVKNAISKQLRTYAVKVGTYSSLTTAQKNLGQDMQPVSNFGLSVNVYKQQLLKISKHGVKDFLKSTKKRAAEDNFEYPESITNMLDAKAQLMLKGYDSLNSDQQDLIRLFYRGKDANRSMKRYQGFDAETTSEINTIIQNGLKNSGADNPVTAADIKDEILRRVPEMAEFRATRIVNTEVAQSVQATRYNLYLEDGWNEKKWLTVGDDVVREEHLGNASQGWIGVDEEFQNGAYSPTDEINCRCDLLFRKSTDSSEEGDNEE